MNIAYSLHTQITASYNYKNSVYIHIPMFVWKSFYSERIFNIWNAFPKPL